MTQSSMFEGPDQDRHSVLQVKNRGLRENTDLTNRLWQIQWS